MASKSMDALVVQLIDRVNELHENGAEEVTGVRTGFYKLDTMTARHYFWTVSSDCWTLALHIRSSQPVPRTFSAISRLARR